MDKVESLKVKGVAILLMIWHHLFGFNNRVPKYISILDFKGYKIEWLIANFAKICVAIFLFISGYALYKRYKDENSMNIMIKKAKKFYLNYLLIFIIFIPIGFLGLHEGKFKFDIIEFIENILLIKSTYNFEWWFVSLYIGLLLFTPSIIKLLNKFPFKVIIGSILIAFLSEIISIDGFNNSLISIVKNLIFWQHIFVVGMIFSKYSLLYKLKIIVLQLNKFIIVFILVFCIMFRLFIAMITNSVYLDFILTPIVIVCILGLFNKDTLFSKLIIFFGENSMYLWLIHTFFCYYYFQKYVFIFKYSILIFLFTVIISTIVSILIKKINIKIKAPGRKIRKVNI